MERTAPTILLFAAVIAAGVLGAGPAVAQNAPPRHPSNPLTPDAAITQAAARNPALRATLLDIRVAEAETRAVLDERVPTFVAGISGSYGESLSTTVEGTVSNASRRAGADVGFLYVTDAGTQLSLGLTTSVVQRTTNRDVSTRTSFELGPTWGSDLPFSIRQPLFRGGGDVREASIASVRAAEQATRHRVQGEASAFVSDVLAPAGRIRVPLPSSAVSGDGTNAQGRRLPSESVPVGGTNAQGTPSSGPLWAASRPQPAGWVAIGAVVAASRPQPAGWVGIAGVVAAVR